MPTPNFENIISQIESGLIDPNKPNIVGGSNRREGELKGVPIFQAGTGICNVLHWIKDNFNYNVVPCVELRWDGAFLGWKVYDKDGVLVFERAAIGFQGLSSQSSPVLAIEELGKAILSKLATHVKNTQ